MCQMSPVLFTLRSKENSIIPPSTLPSLSLTKIIFMKSMSLGKTSNKKNEKITRTINLKIFTSINYRYEN